MRGFHRGSVNSPHKWPVTRKVLPFDDAIMSSSYGLLPVQHYEITRIGTALLLVVSSGSKCNENLNNDKSFFQERKMLPETYWPFCSGLNVLSVYCVKVCLEINQFGFAWWEIYHLAIRTLSLFVHCGKFFGPWIVLFNCSELVEYYVNFQRKLHVSMD